MLQENQASLPEESVNDRRIEEKTSYSRSYTCQWVAISLYEKAYENIVLKKGK